MANLRLPIQERHLTPDQVENLDARRRRGQLAMTIGWQALLVTTLLTLWVGQDLTYSPGFERPIFYWACVTGLIAVCSLLYGISLRRGIHEFTSY